MTHVFIKFRFFSKRSGRLSNHVWDRRIIEFHMMMENVAPGYLWKQNNPLGIRAYH